LDLPETPQWVWLKTKQGYIVKYELDKVAEDIVTGEVIFSLKTIDNKNVCTKRKHHAKQGDMVQFQTIFKSLEDQ